MKCVEGIMNTKNHEFQVLDTDLETSGADKTGHTEKDKISIGHVMRVDRYEILPFIVEGKAARTKDQLVIVRMFGLKI